MLNNLTMNSNLSDSQAKYSEKTNRHGDLLVLYNDWEETRLQGNGVTFTHTHYLTLIILMYPVISSPSQTV